MRDHETSHKAWWGEDDPNGTSWKTGSPTKDARMDAYVEWLVTPKAERDPRTKSKLAERIGVTTATLRNYDKEPFVQREVLKRGRGLAKSQRALEVVNALYDRALGAESEAAANTAAKLFLEWIEQTVNSEDSPIEELSDEELVERMVQMQTKLNERIAEK